MKTMAISQFKTNALKTIDWIAKTKESVIITKRGKPMAQVVPIIGSGLRKKPGKLAHTLIFEKDILTPLGEEIWEACR